MRIEDRRRSNGRLSHEEFLNRLENVRELGDGTHKAQCPLHDSQRRAELARLKGRKNACPECRRRIKEGTAVTLHFVRKDEPKEYPPCPVCGEPPIVINWGSR